MIRQELIEAIVEADKEGINPLTGKPLSVWHKRRRRGLGPIADGSEKAFKYRYNLDKNNIPFYVARPEKYGYVNLKEPRMSRYPTREKRFWGAKARNSGRFTMRPAKGLTFPSEGNPWAREK